LQHLAMAEGVWRTVEGVAWRQRSLLAYATMAAAYAALGRSERAAQLLLEALQDDALPHDEALKGINLALHVAAALPEPSVRAALVSRLQERARDWSLRLDRVTYNVLLRQAHDEEEEDNLLEAMTREGTVPSTDTYNTLLRRRIRLRDRDGAMDMLDRMMAAGVPRDHVTYNSLLRLCETSSQLGKVLEGMREDGLAPDAATARAQLNFYALHGGREDEAVLTALQDTLSDGEGDTYSYLNARLLFHARQLDVGQVLMDLAELRQRALPLRPFTYHRLMALLPQLQALDSQAHDLLDTLVNFSVRSLYSPFTSLLSLLIAQLVLMVNGRMTCRWTRVSGSCSRLMQCSRIMSECGFSRSDCARSGKAR